MGFLLHRVTSIYDYAVRKLRRQGFLPRRVYFNLVGATVEKDLPRQLLHEQPVSHHPPGVFPVSSQHPPRFTSSRKTG